MAACEKCWGDAYLRSLNTGRSQAECYREILAEREASGEICTIEQQRGTEKTLTDEMKETRRTNEMKKEIGKKCRWCGKVFSQDETEERFCSKPCAQKAAGINTQGDAESAEEAVSPVNRINARL